MFPGDRTGCVPLWTGQVVFPWGQVRLIPPGDRTGSVPLGTGQVVFPWALGIGQVVSPG